MCVMQHLPRQTNDIYPYPAMAASTSFTVNIAHEKHTFVLRNVLGRSVDWIQHAADR